MLREKYNVKKYILDKVEKNIIDNKLIKNNDKILVAVSGGPDSMCLLTVLHELRFKLKDVYNIEYFIGVAHVNHMIRNESDEEYIYVKNWCDKLDIPMYYLKEDVPNISKKMKLSEETCGRKIRYDFFNKVCSEYEYNKVATAHNLNDDTETILLNIIRGCGLNGLTGMSFELKNIIRPLLNIEKKLILEYNNTCNINPCIDKTNFENTYSRNKIRNLLIPNLEKEYNCNVVENIIRMKNIVKQDEKFLEDYTQKIVEDAISENNNYILFDFSKILSEHDSIVYRAVRNIIELCVGSLDGISNIHIYDIIKLLKKNIKKKRYIMGNKFTIEIVNKNIAKIQKGGKNEEKFNY